MGNITLWIKSNAQKPIFEVIIYMIIIIGGSLLPVWGGIVLYKLFSVNVNINIFLDNGQFFIYSAALYTPSCYLLYRNKNSDNIFHSIVFLISILLLLLSAILFAGISVYSIAGNIFKLNFNFVRSTSVVLFVLSIITTFYAQWIQSKVSRGPNLKSSSENEIDILESNFDTL